MEKNQQATYRSWLLDLRDNLRRNVNTAEDALREDVMATGDITTVPTHPADMDAEGLDVEVAIARNEESLLEEVTAAIARLEAGTFGTCQQCGREIGRERLEAIPYTAYCIDCARGQRESTNPQLRTGPRPR
ncbi:MAG TPA: TraR/DksA C4-type zinc finger protein [Pirellulales bacterium]|jgi:RNA polymerase-binding protein DksA|nr:TraR/DksA C4-type zinc finger protein [Pirellulales bacterium]